MREGKKYLSLFLAAAITVSGVNVGSAFQVNAANNDAATVSEWRLLTPGDVTSDDGKPELTALIVEIEKLNQNGYTAETWKKLADALAEAKRVNNDANATKAQRVDALNALIEAKDGLVVSPDDGQKEADKKALNAKIKEAEALKQTDYKPETWTAFKTALDAAKEVAAQANATQAQVDKALADLNAAITGLKQVSPDDGQEVNKTALKAKIDEVKKAQAAYTPASWDAFKPALAAAEAVAAKADATQKEVDDALTALNAAMDKLVKLADKTALKAEIARTAGLKQAAYTPASWTKLQTELTAAKSADANANATQAQVDQACASLKTAINTLVKVANKAELKKSIDAANKLKKADYTSSTWKKFDAALKEAKAVYSNANATQAQVDAAKKKLDDAKKALKKKVIKVTKVKITNGKSLKIAAGKKVTLKTTVAPKNASNKKVKWSISKKDKKYATVSAKGVVTTKKAGKGKTITVTATAADGSKKKATVKISIMKNAVIKVTLKAKSKTLKVGKKMTVKAIVKTNGKKANKKLAWKSSNTKYATVNSKGVVTAKKAGKGKDVTITATATDGTGKKGKIKIRIKK